MNRWHFLRWLLIGALALAGCGAAFEQTLPTARPTETATFTPTMTRTPGAGEPTATRTLSPQAATSGPSPTPLIAFATSAVAANTTATAALNPNAPRIEFFTSDNILGVAPGSTLTLFWSTRAADTVIIYRTNRSGQRTQVWNVPPDGSLAIATRSTDRGTVDFVLRAEQGSLSAELTLSIPLACPDAWFFAPAPDDCPNGPAQPVPLIEEPFERGRMLHNALNDTVYALFNDGAAPAWVAFDNRYDPTIHPESEAGFVPPPGFYQPTGILGFLWRGNDTVRNRLGLALLPPADYEGFVQSTSANTGAENLYISSIDGSVLLLLPDGASWQIIAPPAP
ncbi:MAG: hypothetical protein HXY40_15495 [Chloroflexi bacterium]|nr:hypothetical protein [Chloroflexota bacterium]